MGALLRHARRHRQDRLIAILRLDLRFFVHAQHDRSVRRRHVKTDNILHFVDEQRIGRQLKCFRPMRLQPKRGPDPTDSGVRKPGLGCHGADLPMGASFGVVFRVRSITWAACTSDTVRGRPARYASVSPSMPSCTNRRRHLPTVRSRTPRRSELSCSATPLRIAEQPGIDLIVNAALCAAKPELRKKTGPCGSIPPNPLTAPPSSCPYLSDKGL